MGLLDNYKKINEHDRPFITVRDRSITFSKAAIEKLHYSSYVCMYVQETSKHVAFQEAPKGEDGAIAFYKPPKEGRAMLVRISDKSKAELVLDIAGLEGSKTGIRFYGKLYDEDKAIDFDLTKPVSD